MDSTVGIPISVIAPTKIKLTLYILGVSISCALDAMHMKHNRPRTAKDYASKWSQLNEHQKCKKSAKCFHLFDPSLELYDRLIGRLFFFVAL